MKNFLVSLFSIRKIHLFMPVFLLAIFVVANAQIYKANNLSGVLEEMPNNSPGTGNAIVTIKGDSMRVQATFSGLQATTTVAHIHAATATPGTGSSGVASPTPTFPGFPGGVTSGSYDMTFDMTLTSSYNSSYVTANGGTAASAFAALKAALNNGTAYFNIHTTMYPAGEIRGFFKTQTYQNLSSMLTYDKLLDAISSGSPGDIIQQINDAVETAPIELPLGLIFNFPSPFTFAINIL